MLAVGSYSACKVCIDHYKLQSRNDCPYCRKPLASLFGIPSLFNDLKSEHMLLVHHITATVMQTQYTKINNVTIIFHR